MHACGSDPALMPVDGAGHGFFHADPHFEPVYPALGEFVCRVFSL
ncbi:MAG: hypothetical protein AB7Y46_03560 [Armatimonadota bacterium]